MNPFTESMFVLFAILTLGAWIGQWSWRGISLGTAGVLLPGKVNSNFFFLRCENSELEIFGRGVIDDESCPREVGQRTLSRIHGRERIWVCEGVIGGESCPREGRFNGRERAII